MLGRRVIAVGIRHNNIGTCSMCVVGGSAIVPRIANLDTLVDYSVGDLEKI